VNRTVSVVVPTYNVERWIEQTLDSVLAQTHADLELVVVDDGSRDTTRERVAAVAARDARVRLIAQANQGVCVARNRGLAQSSGAFVCFLDHDDVWAPWKLAEQLAAFAREPEAGVVFTDFSNWLAQQGGGFSDPATDLPPLAGTPPRDDTFSGWVHHQFLLDCWALTSTAMIRREVLERFGAFDPALPYSEDWELWLRLAVQVPFVKLAAVSTLYRQHADQGNRKLRDIDYRTRLLERAVREHGLVSRDGRQVGRGHFLRTLAKYHMQFGLHHLEHGNRGVALRAFAKAWRHHPTRLRYPALLVAAAVGWKPGPYAG
jgi:glycosyltransferase involved in cell wall biosynthesis